MFKDCRLQSSAVAIIELYAMSGEKKIVKNVCVCVCVCMVNAIECMVSNVGLDVSLILI